MSTWRRAVGTPGPLPGSSGSLTSNNTRRQPFLVCDFLTYIWNVWTGPSEPGVTISLPGTNTESR